MEFNEFPKIPRLFRDMVVTEKIDGTNASVFIEQWINPPGDMEREDESLCVYSEKHGIFYRIAAGSRTKWITPESDNYGFAKFVHANALALAEGLGEGHHFGEWWGNGIQRGYGMKEKRFSLFNVHRWNAENVPSCCSVVPIIYDGKFNLDQVAAAMDALSTDGSYAAPGYMKPEGVVVFHKAGGYLFKATIEKDDEPKGKSNG